jgi:hypothetical protein
MWSWSLWSARRRGRVLRRDPINEILLEIKEKGGLLEIEVHVKITHDRVTYTNA